MSLETWVTNLVRRGRATVLLALLTTFAGVALLIDQPKGTVLEWFALPLLTLGGAIFAWVVWPRRANAKPASVSVASRLLARLTFQGRVVPLFPAIGVAIVVADLAYNLLLSPTPALQTEDTIVLFAAASLLGYNVVPSRFARERDFVLLFFLCLNAILVLPLLTARLLYVDFQQSVDVYSWVALAPETGAVLTLLGISNSLQTVAGSTAPGLTFTPEHLGIRVTVVITAACSGIYSFGIFASAFVAFVLTDFELPTRRMWLLLGLGLMTAYGANILRMVLIVLIGYYTDTAQTDLQNMLVAHSYGGWVIFLGWIALFWSGVFRLLPRDEPAKARTAFSLPGEHRESICGICRSPLTPIVPAIRCQCSAHFHRDCATMSEMCPKCGSPWVTLTPQTIDGI